MITVMDIEKQLKKVERDIRTLKQKIDEHVGDYGSDVHAAAQNGIPGFMSGLQAQQFVGTRTYLGNNDDGSKREVEFIENGFWYSNSNLISGLPENLEGTETLIMLDVYNYGGGRKQIKLIEAWNNRIWTKNFHSPSGTEPVTSVGWIMQSGSLLLWSGSQMSGKVNFINNRQNYLYLEILYRNAAGNRYSAKILRETNKFGLTAQNIPDNENRNILTSEMQASVTDYALEITQNLGIIISGNRPEFVNDDTGKITITTILGVNG